MIDIAPQLRASMLIAAIAVSGCGDAPANESRDMQTLTSQRQYSGEDEIDVRIEYGAGTLVVAQGDSSTLYQMELYYDAAHFDPITDYDRNARTLHLGVEPEEDGHGIHGHFDESRATIRLTPAAALDLSLEFGGGTADLDLGGLALRAVDISTGASETEIEFGSPNPIAAEYVRIGAGAAGLQVSGLGNAHAARIEFSGGVGASVLDFSGEWTRDATVTAQLGVGALTLRLPRDVGVRIERESVLTTFDAEDLVRRGSEYFSANWEDAPHHLTMNVEAALGSIDVEWIDATR